MKWYFAINEEGVETDAGLLARLAVVSARRHTSLKPHLLYRGRRNRFTAWMEDHGVTVIDVLPAFEAAMQRAIAAGWYPRGMTGHWLRTEICNIETEDGFVLYTDIDVVFLRPFDLDGLRPALFACAPETNPHERAHFSTGVMLMNIAALRADYPRLRATIEARFADPANGAFTDQRVYNNLYTGQQDRLDLIYNWKPYWPLNPETAIYHFHGPKLDAIRRMFDGSWNWHDAYGAMAGAMVADHLENYLHYFRVMREYTEPGERLRETLDGLLRDAPPTIPRPGIAQPERDRGAAPGPSEVASHPPRAGMDEPAARAREAERTAAWTAEGPRGWRRTDGLALVVQDVGIAEARWLGALRQGPADRPDPTFLTDPSGRIRTFPAAEDARLACDDLLAGEAKKSGSTMGMVEPKGGPG